MRKSKFSAFGDTKQWVVLQYSFVSSFVESGGVYMHAVILKGYGTVLVAIEESYISIILKPTCCKIVWDHIVTCIFPISWGQLDVILSETI